MNRKKLLSKLADTGSDTQHQQQNTLELDKPDGWAIWEPSKFKSLTFITENDLTECLSKAHGISIVALIE